MKSIFLMTALMSFSLNSSLAAERERKTRQVAPEEEFHFSLQPVVGYQSVSQSYPYAHHAGMMIFGGRILAGTEPLSLEFSYLHGSSSETFSSPNTTVETSRDLIRLGVRSVFPVVSELSLVGRAGEQASHDAFTISSASSSSTSSSSWAYHPYLGAGVILRVIPQIVLSVEETYVFSGDFDTSFGLSVFF